MTNNAAISLTEDYTPTDDDKDSTGKATPDGDLDGPFAKGTNRFGIRLVGPGVFTGDITQSSTGSITIEGNNSAGISLESGLVGNLTTGGTISVVGDNSYGVHVAGPVTGKVSINGGTTVTGLNATGVAIDGAVSGAFVVQGGVTTTGYRYTTRPSTKELRAILDADDLLQGGPAVRVAANVGGGVLLDAPPLDLDKDKTDEDGDGVADASEGTAALVTYGGAPALLIGSDTQSVTIGAVGTGDNAYGLIAKGGVTANGVYDGVAATAIQIGGNAGQTHHPRRRRAAGQHGHRHRVRSQCDRLPGQGRRVGPNHLEQGPISAFSISEGQFDARAVAIDAGSTVNTFRNAGSIASTMGGEKGNAYGVIDNSGNLTTIENTGRSPASVVPTDDADDKDDADTFARQRGGHRQGDRDRHVSKNTTGVTLTQNGVNDGDDGKDGIAVRTPTATAWTTPTSRRSSAPSTSARSRHLQRPERHRHRRRQLRGRRRHPEHQRRRQRCWAPCAIRTASWRSTSARARWARSQRRDHQRHSGLNLSADGKLLFAVERRTAPTPTWWSPARSTSRPAPSWSAAADQPVDRPDQLCRQYRRHADRRHDQPGPR